jgi:uncharacterized Tic20 family protein
MNQDVPGYPPPQAPPPMPPGGMPPAAPAPLSDSDARTWAMVAHLSILLNLVTGFLGIVAPLVIYIVFKDRSRYVAYQAMQAFMFQLIGWGAAWIVIGILWTITGFLSAFLIGLLCVPIPLLAMLIPLAALGYGVYGGIEANQGKDFRYWLVGDWVRGMVPA